MLEALQKGDEVVTAGGIVGKIGKLTDQYVDARDGAERRDDRAAAVGGAAPAEGHDQGAVAHAGRPVAAAPRLRAVPARQRPLHRRPRRCEPSKPPMNRYPLWKYIVIGVALLIGFVYTLPNFFPEVPAVQVSLVEGDGQDRRRAAGARSRRRSAAAKIAYRGAVARRDRRQGALRRHRHADQGQDVLQAALGDELHRRAQPALGVAAVADRDRRAADVPRPRPARRRALPAAGRHEGGARQGGRPLHDRHPLAAAREEDPVQRRRARGQQRRRPLPRRGRAHAAPASRSRKRSPTSRCARPRPAAATCGSSRR